MKCDETVEQTTHLIDVEAAFLENTNPAIKYVCGVCTQTVAVVDTVKEEYKSLEAIAHKYKFYLTQIKNPETGNVEAGIICKHCYEQLFKTTLAMPQTTNHDEAIEYLKRPDKTIIGSTKCGTSVHLRNKNAIKEGRHYIVINVKTTNSDEDIEDINLRQQKRCRMSQQVTRVQSQMG